MPDSIYDVADSDVADSADSADVVFTHVTCM